MAGLAKIVLKAGREKPIRQHHPWVFSGAVNRTEGSPEAGSVVDVVTTDRVFLARGVFNPQSQITVRLLTWDESELVDDAFWLRNVERSLAGRTALSRCDDTDAYRLVNGESDGLPGFIVDRYGDWLVVQFSALAAEVGRLALINSLAALVQPRGILERTDVSARQKEGLPAREEVLRGEPPPEAVHIHEQGHRFMVHLWKGQKTGFYLDQRLNRRRVAEASAGGDVLNVFSYTGGFAVYLLHAGVEHVVNLDTSRRALEVCEENLRLSNFDPDIQAEQIQGDAFQVLRDWRQRERRFDAVVLDPPKFATNARQVASATRGYKDINLLAMQLIRPGGLLATFSCTGLVSPDLFQKVVFGAAVDAGRDVQIIEKLSQGDDHPILLSFPEGEYLKGLLCRVW